MKVGREKVSTESPCSLCCSQERLPELDNQSGWERLEPWQTVHAPAPGIEPALQCKMDVLALKDAFFFFFNVFHCTSQRRQRLTGTLLPAGTGFLKA